MTTKPPKEYSGDMDASGLRCAIVVSRYNAFVTKELLGGALDVLVRHGAKAEDQSVIWVPGGFELPLAAQAALERGGIDGLIALGCVMRGQTTNNELIAGEITKGLASLSLAHKIPVGFGVLTPDTTEQALERSGLKMGNKGAEAALAVIEMASMLKRLRGK